MIVKGLVEADYIINISMLEKSGKYIVKGSVINSNLQVVDSHKITINSDELLTGRDELVTRFINNLSNYISDEEVRKCRSNITKNPDAYTCLLKGLSLYKLGDVSLSESKAALSWFEKSAELDPYSARALAWRQCCLADLAVDVLEPGFMKSGRMVLEKALQLDPNDHEVHRVCGGLFTVAQEHELGDYHFGKAIELNPNDTRILLRSGYYRSFYDRQLNDLNSIERAIELNPNHPNYYHFDKGVASFNNMRYQAAFDNLKYCTTNNLTIQLYSAAALEALGHSEEARSFVHRAKRKFPDYQGMELTKMYPFACYANNEKGERAVQLLEDAGWYE